MLGELFEGFADQSSELGLIGVVLPRRHGLYGLPENHGLRRAVARRFEENRIHFDGWFDTTGGRLERLGAGFRARPA